MQETEQQLILSTNTYSDLIAALPSACLSPEYKLQLESEHIPSLLETHYSVLTLYSLETAGVIVDIVWLITSFIDFPRTIIYGCYSFMVLGAIFACNAVFNSLNSRHKTDNEKFIEEIYLLKLQLNVLCEQNHLSVETVFSPPSFDLLKKNWSRAGQAQQSALNKSILAGCAVSGFITLTYLWAAPDLLALLGFINLATTLSGPLGLAIILISTSILALFSTYKLYQCEKIKWMRNNYLNRIIKVKHQVYLKSAGLFQESHNLLTEECTLTNNPSVK